MVEITALKKNEQDNKLTVSVVPTKKSDKVRQKMDKIMDNPYLVDESMIKAIKKLLKIKKQAQIKNGVGKVLLEKWDMDSGVWKITIVDEEKPIKIKLGMKGTETNEVFFKLYQSKNDDVKAAEIRQHVSNRTGKILPNINIGASVATLRKWIKNGLGKKYKDLVAIRHDKKTKKYRLELNF